MMKLTCLALFLACISATAQSVHQFTRGLVAGPCHRYGREAIVYDQLAYQLYSGTFRTPVEGRQLFVEKEGKSISWRMVEADSLGRLRGEELGGGYLYLTYDAQKAQSAIINISGNSMFFFNGEPHGGDIYRDGWMFVPVKLKKGLNEILVRSGFGGRFQGVTARLLLSEKPVSIRTEDATLPHVVVGNNDAELWGALVVINSSEKEVVGMEITSSMEGVEMTTAIPSIGAMTTRKVGFQFNPQKVSEKKRHACLVRLKQKGKVIDEKTININAVNPADHQSHTFRSKIDGSIQYYSIAPQNNENRKSPALFLSVHGAAVEAISQARAYIPKDWGVVVAPTNRRPRGFNWEDWGRLDALEVLGIAVEKFSPDPSRIYLTGHSMGGHGTWYLGSTYPDKWAAIGPCAGYPTLTAYGSADGRIPEKGRSEVETILLRSSNPSNVIELAKNYKSHGIYIHHGDSDKVVSVNYSRQMRQILGEFHKDFTYYEYPGGSHWFSNQSVDWPPMFEYFKWHTILPDSAVHVIDFSTANPAISAQNRWATIVQQQRPLQYSRVDLKRSVKAGTISGVTENVSILRLSMKDFPRDATVRIALDGQAVDVTKSSDEIYLYHKDQWGTGAVPDPAQRGMTRNGTFKEPFNHQFVMVYGTKGNTEENAWSYAKARYDAEVWYYRANGSLDLIADKNFEPASYPDRGVILYGNATTNGAWQKLLGKSPVQLQRGAATVGDKRFTGDDIGAYFIWPRSDSKVASVAVVGGTGLPGMKATEANQYFAGGSGFPDYFIFTTAMLKDGADGIRAAGFYGNDWTVEKGEWAEARPAGTRME